MVKKKDKTTLNCDYQSLWYSYLLKRTLYSSERKGEIRHVPFFGEVSNNDSSFETIILSCGHLMSLLERGGRKREGETNGW